jgi:putative FmdB family regulatory protein
MPLYEYECPSCGERRTEMRHSKARKLPCYCPYCSDLPTGELLEMELVPSAANAQFKGPGFHTNDYPKVN